MVLRATPYLSLLGLFALGCSALSPEVGPQQDMCGAASFISGAGTNAGGSSAYGTQTGGQTASIRIVCSADAGSACDDCEAKWCCTQRLDCYQDPVCACADTQMDSCQDSAGEDSAAAEGCWRTFASQGTVEATRLTCIQAWCAGPCGAPPL